MLVHIFVQYISVYAIFFSDRKAVHLIAIQEGEPWCSGKVVAL
jgi:hypothetical protein